jgi:drug/metabolite transporter (DMT)-like permease
VRESETEITTFADPLTSRPACMSERRVNRYKIELMLLAVSIVWGSNFVVMKLVLEVMHPHVINVFRIASSGMVLAVLHARRQRALNQSFFEPLHRFPGEILLIGIVGWWMYQVVFILGLNRTSAGTAALIMASLPLWTALLSVGLRVERLSLIGWLGIGVTLAGTSTVILSGSKAVDLGATSLIGNLIMLTAAVLWALATVLTKKLVNRVTPVGITVLALIVSIPLLLLTSIPYWSQVRWENVTWLVWGAIFFSGSLSTGVAIVMWNHAVKTMGASHTAAFQNLVPIIALVLSYFILGEHIVLGQVIGGASTIVGLVIMRRGRESRRTDWIERHS